MQKFPTQIVAMCLLSYFLSLNVFALNIANSNIPHSSLSESLLEQKQGNQFLQLIWDSERVIADVEMATYLNKLGQELVTYSGKPDKHFGFFLLSDSSINAFAGPYGYIGVHSGMLLSSDSEAELAGVLSHEIAHVTQNHLRRFGQKTAKHKYLLLAGILAAALANNSEATEAIVASTIAGTAQQSINFTREHEWEADRVGIRVLKKSGFDTQGLANFFRKLKDAPNAQEFLRSHPLSVNRISDSLQRAQQTENHRRDSFTYLSTKAKLHYHTHSKQIKPDKNQALTHYMQAYAALEQQDYQQAKQYVNQLLVLNQSKSSYILAGRIYAKLGDIKQAQLYFNQNNLKEDESSVYYAAKAYAENQQTQASVSLLKSFLRKHTGTYQSYQLLSALYVKQGRFDRAHVENAKTLTAQGKLEQAIGQYERAKNITHSQDLFDVITVKIATLQQRLDIYKEL